MKLWLELLQLFLFRSFACSLIRSASLQEDVLGLYFVVVTLITHRWATNGLVSIMIVNGS